jgi:hypothetical protein
MAEVVFDAMGAVLARWTMGAPAGAAAPMWRDALGSDPEEAELRLLALSGQFLATAVTAEPPADLRMLPDVPALALPTVPESARALIRRLLAAPVRNELLRFVALRGWTLHPGDWMPEADDDGAPDVYAPWRDWVESAASTVKGQRETADEITLENWDDWWPAARKVALTELRRRDPAAARALIENKLGGENADVRLRLLGLLETGLSEADVPFLESLATTDRAPKVKALAAAFLARLNHGASGSDDLAELKGFFAVKVKGLLRRSRVIEFENAKTPAQRHRRAALFETVDLAGFAAALGLTGPELLAAWSWNTDAEADQGFTALIARTAPDALVLHAAEAVIGGETGGLHRLLVLLPRLTARQRSGLAATALSRGCSFELARTIAGGAAQLENPLGTPAGAALLAALSRAEAKPTEQAAELQALGLLTHRAWARRVLDRLNAAGIVQGDPRLDMLRLNEALEDRGMTP